MIVGFMLLALISFTVIILVYEMIRNKRKSGWVTIEGKMDVQVEYDLLNDVKETPLITEL